MSTVLPVRKNLAVRVLAVAAIAVVLLTTALANVASAHGNVVDPASRNYGCLDRWRNNHMAPEMQTQDPMCYRAWQANPNAMWNWNGLFRENVGGNHQAAVPDGQLCSAGHTEGGRYNFLDTPGPWIATPVNNSFRIRLFDQASHGADYIRVYVTRQGFDPVTQPLRWANLELVGQIGDTPASQWQQATGGVEITVPANAAGRTGRHMVYTIWQASHLDQPYYLCSDVRFPGGAGDPTVNPTTPATTATRTTPPVQTTTPTQVTPTNTGGQPTGGAAGCSAGYTMTSQWNGGFQGEVRVTAGSAAINGWTVTLSFPNGQQVQQVWNATGTPSGSTLTARNASYNGRLAAGANATFGFLANGSGATGTPTLSCAATA